MRKFRLRVENIFFKDRDVSRGCIKKDRGEAMFSLKETYGYRE